MDPSPAPAPDPDPRLRISAVLLAAGAGSRLGGRPKSLLMLDGVPLIRRQLLALLASGLDELVVVLGHHADSIEPQTGGLPVKVVRNPSPDDGQVSSQRLGLAALSGTAGAVLVALADQPLINAQDIASLIDAWHRRPAGSQMLVPQVAGKPGNPVMLSARVRDQILAGDAQMGGKQWRAAHPDAVAWFVTDNRHFKVDVDTPEDIANFERDTGQALTWPAAQTSPGGAPTLDLAAGAGPTDRPS